MNLKDMEDSLIEMLQENIYSFPIFKCFLDVPVK